MIIPYHYEHLCNGILHGIVTWRGLFDYADDELVAGVQVAHLANVLQRCLNVSTSCLLQGSHRHLLKHTHTSQVTVKTLPRKALVHLHPLRLGVMYQALPVLDTTTRSTEGILVTDFCADPGLISRVSPLCLLRTRMLAFVRFLSFRSKTNDECR